MHHKTTIHGMILALAIFFALAATPHPAHAEDNMTWDKTFPLSDKVIHEKVEFHNRFGIYIAADMYKPKRFDPSVKYRAIIVGTPYGGVKEQGAGIYAQAMAERGYVAIAFDESYNGESGGFPRRTSSVEGFVEDFHAAVDYMGTRPYIDRNKIGVIGLCGSGGFSLSAAQVDHRIKAVATVSMYDMSRVKANGWMDSWTEAERNAYLDQLGEERWKEYAGGEVKTLGLPETIDEQTDPITREFYEYYKMPRGQHPRSSAHFTMTSDMAFMNYQLLGRLKSISPRPILFVIGEKAHSRYFSEDAYKMAAEPKELYIVPGATHVDLYDRVDMIPFGKLDDFFTKALR
ncbi:MAG: alpha/beta hydrolase [Desulfovibrionaceae bacterium]